jgi:hypothetical protein
MLFVRTCECPHFFKQPTNFYETFKWKVQIGGHPGIVILNFLKLAIRMTE